MPSYQHHTTEHTYIGKHKEFDLYYCPAIDPMLNGPIVVARYGNDTHEYRTGYMALVGANPTSYPPELVVAYHNAVLLGLD